MLLSPDGEDDCFLKMLCTPVCNTDLKVGFLTPSLSLKNLANKKGERRYEQYQFSFAYVTNQKRLHSLLSQLPLPA